MESDFNQNRGAAAHRTTVREGGSGATETGGAAAAAPYGGQNQPGGHAPDTAAVGSVSADARAPASEGGFERTAVPDMHQVAQQAQQAAHQAAHQASEQVHQAAHQAQEMAGQALGQVRDQITGRLRSEKDRAVDGIGMVAQSLRQTSEQLQQRGQGVLGEYVETAADQADRLASYLRQRDLEQIGSEVGEFARSRPAVFLGGAFVLGVLSARFFKSSREALFSDDGRREGTHHLTHSREARPEVVEYVHEHNQAQV